MVGASGTFTNLHYPNQAEVPGLFDSSSQGGSAVLLVAHFEDALRRCDLPVPAAVVVSQRRDQNETQTHALLFFYTLYATSRFSISVLRRAAIRELSARSLPLPQSTPTPGSRSWNPAAGGSLSWQGRLTNAGRELLAHDFERRRTDRGGANGQRHRIDPPTNVARC